jgi:predicted metal-dependent hydrolase
MQRSNFETLTGLVEYTITRRSRLKKRLHMELDEHGGLVVVAPRHWTKAHIGATLSLNTSRIERFLISARQRQLEPLRFTSGELHFYLGERYHLAVHTGVARKPAVHFTGQEIRVVTRMTDPESVRKALQAWYHRQALKILDSRLQAIASRADWVNNRPIPLKLRKMKRTWGNCSSKGLIKLNTHLIKAPLSVIDSVIAHELCHLREMNHGRAFYALLERLNPKWREDRARLRSEGNGYLL